MTQRRQLLIGAFLLAVTCWTNVFQADAEEPTPYRPNILLIVTDDQGMHLSCLGTQGIETPSIDALAQSGVLFTSAYTVCSSCSPSRSSILTGMYPHSNGHWRNTHGPTLNEPAKVFTREVKARDAIGVHEDISTLPELFNEAGYFTGITQKFHLSPPWKYPFQSRIPCGHTAEQTERAASTFFQQCGDRPFFLMANIGNTHRPFATPGRIGEEPVRPDEIDVPPMFPDTPAMRRDLAEYFSTVEGADLCVGGLLKALDESRRANETIICFISDHGFPYLRAKATVYRAGIHVPMIWVGPDIKRDVECDQLASAIDIAPTVLSFADIERPKAMQGTSLRPWLEGASDESPHEFVFAEHNAHGPGEEYPTRAVTNGRLIYLRNLTPDRKYTPPADLVPGGAWGNHAYDAIVDAKATHPTHYAAMQSTLTRPAEELYDLDKDPGELNNVIDDPAYAEQLSALRERLDTWQAETDDPGDPSKIIRRK